MFKLQSAIFGLLAILSFSPALAGAPHERIAIMLTGSGCHEIQQTVEPALRHSNGVVAVDGTSVPGHLLIDVEEGKTSAQDLLTVIHASAHNTLSCQIDVMRSCITAPRLAKVQAPDK